MTDALLSCQALSKSFGGLVALSGFECSVDHGEIVGLIGPNGAGKTTLFNLLTGFLGADEGSAKLQGRELIGLPAFRIARIGVSRQFQRLRLIRRLSVLENVMLSVPYQPGEGVANLFFRWAACSRYERANRKPALALLEDVGLIEKAGDPAEALSYGQQKLLAIACCLATRAKLLLFDEPISGIAPEMIRRILAIIRALPAQGKSAIIIEHDIDAVSDVSDRMIFLDAGRKITEGTPDEVRNSTEVIKAYLE